MVKMLEIAAKEDEVVSIVTDLSHNAVFSKKYSFLYFLFSINKNI